jgi:proline iminopeptidase
MKKLTAENYREDSYYPRVVRAVQALRAKGDVVTPIDVFVQMGMLRAADVESWRFGQVPFLERVIQGSLGKTSRILRLLRLHAHDLNMRPSQTAYVKWGTGRRTPLRFSKSGDPKIEEAYSRHFLASRLKPGGRKRRVALKNAEIFYSTRGEGPVCLVLSAIGTMPYERMTPPPLTDHFRFVYVDLRGGGRSTGDPADLTLDVLAEDLEGVRADLGVERVAVLGHSILGALAVEYGRRCPGSVSHVITAGAPPYGDMARLSANATAFFEEDASEDRKRILLENLARMPQNQMLQAQTPMRHFDPRFDAAKLYAQAVYKPALLGHIMGTLLAGWDVTADASSLQVPLFLAHGRCDYIVPYRLWDGIVEKLPNATFRLFDRSGHQPFFEEPEAFVTALTAWMTGEP